MEAATRKRFAGILGRLGSDHDGERAAAALLATRLLRAEGLTWEDVRLPSDIPNRAPPQWRVDLELCRRHKAELTDWERGFVNGLANRTSASPRQRTLLREIADDLRGSGRV